MDIVILIPAYKPAHEFSDLIRELADSGQSKIVVVNDGSSADCAPTFEEIKKIQHVVVLEHAVNLGKGAALKTGLNYAYCNFPDLLGVVTADADGQHLVSDILKVSERLAENPTSLILGVRKFDTQVPLRSRFGNSLTRSIFHFLVGRRISDTQTGLRGIPKALIPNLLKLQSNGYEFELDMLLLCKFGNWDITEETIRTVYSEGNKSSHFNPIVDSMKIYFVLLRSMLASFTTAILDYAVFILIFNASGSIILSQSSSRLAALLYNYTCVRKFVFYSDQNHKEVFPKYVMLVIVSGLLSYSFITLLVSSFAMNVIVAKIIAETIIYIGNFTIQRDFIFNKSRHLVE